MSNQNLIKPFELQVDLSDFDGGHSFAKYRSFRIAGEAEKYKLILGDFVEGDSGDSLTNHNNYPFTTKDGDNDPNTKNCARQYTAAWWYKDGHLSNLNGLYLRGPYERNANGINWKTARGHKDSYKVSEMKLRRPSY